MNEIYFDDSKIRIPEDYLSAMSIGLIQDSSANCIRLSDTQWMDISSIASHNMPEYWRSDLVPFARSARRDYWCWLLEDSACGRVVFCDQDFNEATIYAPDFKSCMFRMLLEEMASSWLCENQEQSLDFVSEQIRSYVKLTHDYFPKEWSSCLSSITGNEIFFDQKEGVAFFIKNDQVMSIVKRLFSNCQIDSPITLLR